MAQERLDESATSKLLAAGDLNGSVGEAWEAKKCLRDLYCLYGEPELAARSIDGLIDESTHRDITLSLAPNDGFSH